MEYILHSTFLLTALGVLILMSLELFFPLIKYEFDFAWKTRLLFFSIIGISITTVIGNTLFVSNHLSLIHILKLENLYNYNVFFQGFICYLLITFVVYWWHRIRHHYDTLWQTFHQVHHSTHRIQTLTAIYSHPLDFMATAVIVNSVSYLILGLSTEAAIYASVITSFFDFWEHTNIKTPKWLGYIVVRPEMHRIHHEKNKHAHNYSIPIWDILFGTYENSHRNVECGFDLSKEKQVLKLLTFQNLDKRDIE